MTHGFLFRGCALTLLAISLTACGGDSGGSSAIDTSQPLADSFMAKVIAVVATSPDDADPRETDSITATSPEDSDPLAVSS